MIVHRAPHVCVLQAGIAVKAATGSLLSYIPCITAVQHRPGPQPHASTACMHAGRRYTPARTLTRVALRPANRPSCAQEFSTTAGTLRVPSIPCARRTASGLRSRPASPSAFDLHARSAPQLWRPCRLAAAGYNRRSITCSFRTPVVEGCLGARLHTRAAKSAGRAPHALAPETANSSAARGSSESGRGAGWRRI